MLILFLIVFIDLVGFGIIIPLLPFYAEHFQASPAIVGLVMATYSAAQFVAAPLWGRLSDRIGRRPVLLATLAGAALSYLWLGFAGSLAVLFTDLRGSTRLYREIGDAVAFGHVMNHFDVLREAIAAAGGALVKTIGDAVMAVFLRPVSAMRAMLRAQQLLASPPEGKQPLRLKVGIHYGPCIAVTLNDRLDYFGSTVNIAARLEGLSSGMDVVISDAVRTDPEVADLLTQPDNDLVVEPFESTLKGFEQERFELWRVFSRS